MMDYIIGLNGLFELGPAVLSPEKREKKQSLGPFFGQGGEPANQLRWAI